MLIIGAAGGHEIQASLTYGAGQIDAVELNPVTVSLLRDTFADYAGNITEHPDVNYVQGEGRTYLARSDETYDIVWFVAPDSYAASNAATAGAFVMSESYLYTREMIEEAFDHLSPGGVIVAQFGDLDFAARPMRTARYLVTARAAIADDIGGDDFADHVGLDLRGRWQRAVRHDQHDHAVQGPGRCHDVPARAGQCPQRPRRADPLPPGRATRRRSDLRRDRRARRRAGPDRRRVPARHLGDHRRPAVLLALHRLRDRPAQPSSAISRTPRSPSASGCC